jgi:hypothetical protein
LRVGKRRYGTQVDRAVERFLIVHRAAIVESEGDFAAQR